MKSSQQQFTAIQLVEGLFDAPTVCGRGLFTRGSIAERTELMILSGPRVCSEKLPNLESGEADLFLQVGLDRYLGPFQGIARYINHSCEPNCAFMIEGGLVKLVSIKAIDSASELTCDYSLTMADDPFELACCCSKSLCREIVREYKYLPEKLKRAYEEQGFVPEYVRRYNNR